MLLLLVGCCLMQVSTPRLQAAHHYIWQYIRMLYHHATLLLYHPATLLLRVLYHPATLLLPWLSCYAGVHLRAASSAPLHVAQ
jgi:hypothetical protein